MSMYVVRLWNRPGRPLQGRVRHVASGEEVTFSEEETLMDFLEGTHAATGLTEALERMSPEGAAESEDTGRKNP